VKYLVTGGAGYLGSHLVYELLAQDNEVIIFDNYSGNLKIDFPNSVTQIHGSIDQKSDIESLNDFSNIDGVFHLAAKKSASESDKFPETYRKVNVEGTKNLLDYCSRRSILNFAFTSSAAVYGAINAPDRIIETDKIEPINQYGKTKKDGEFLVLDWGKSNGNKSVSLRLFNLAGGRSIKFFDKNGENVLPVIMRCLKESRVFQIYGIDLKTPDGSCVRDYVHVTDVVTAQIKAMQYLESTNSRSGEVFNISSGLGISVKQLVEHVSKATNQTLMWEAKNKRKNDPEISVGNSEKAKNVLGWYTEKTINNIIIDTIAAYGFC